MDLLGRLGGPRRSCRTARMARNMVMAATPAAVTGKYPCDMEALAELVTVVVTVKDACSQAPGFINALHTSVGEADPSAHTNSFSQYPPLALFS